LEKVFIAKIIWQIKIPTNNLASEFDVQLRIIRALDTEKATNKAIEIGHKQEETFINSKGKQISWTYINVEFVKEIISFDDGIEICSQIIHANDAMQFIKDIHIKTALNSDALLQKLN
jgi:hypothetical protein